ncbi:MAG: transposase [Verrucomicrobiae bacterium]|nr:transposase [Verrucomicrobiae bacterium]
MARALRVVVAGGWYLVTARGNREEALFLSGEDRHRFLGLVSELPERFALEVHAFVLMDNHYHLLVRTPLGNLSAAIRWLNVTYSIRFNWAHRQTGHVFQGRFKAILLEDEKGVIEVARYVHLNPVRIKGLGLGKADQRRAAVAGAPDPGRELVRRRLEALGEYPWSSWRVYSGKDPAPRWLEVRTLRGGRGRRSMAKPRRALRASVETPVRQGALEGSWERRQGC